MCLLLAVCVGVLCSLYGLDDGNAAAAAHKVPLPLLSPSESLQCFLPSPLHRVFDFILSHQPLTLLLLLVLLFCLPVLFAVFASLCVAHFQTAV